LGVLLNVDDTKSEAILEQDIIQNYLQIFVIENKNKMPSQTKSYPLMPHSSKLFLFEK
jgi:hypothetical protein